MTELIDALNRLTLPAALVVIAALFVVLVVVCLYLVLLYKANR